MQNQPDLLDDLKKRLMAVIEDYKTNFGKNKPVDAKTEQPAANSQLKSEFDKVTALAKQLQQNKEPNERAKISFELGQAIGNWEDLYNAASDADKKAAASILSNIQQLKTQLGNAPSNKPAETKPENAEKTPAETTNKPAETKPENAEKTPAETKPIVASTTLSASVGENGTNKPEDVALIKTLINKFIKAFNLHDKAVLGKVGPTTIKVIKQFQQEKVGLTNPDGLIEVGGKSWKVLNGETQPVAAAALPGADVAGYNAELGQALAKKARSVANSMRTVGRCYAGTCQAVNGFFGKPILYGMSAYMGAKLLAAQPKLFKEISASSTTLTSLPVGTVVVWARGKARKRGEPVTQPHPQHGHIMICLGGGQEASDHVNRIIFQGCGVSCRAFIPISRG